MADPRPSAPKVILSARQTEKAVLGENRAGIYVFNVAESATKHSVAAAVHAAYHVTPRLVRIARVPEKSKWFRGTMGTKRGGKKAYVYLEKGDKIAAS